MKKEDRLLPERGGGGPTRTRRVTAIGLLLAGAIAMLLYFARGAFVPLALAALFALVLSGPVEALHRLQVPRGLSALVIMLSIFAAVAGLLNLVSEPAQQWYAAAPRTLKIIEKKIRPLEQFIDRAQDLRNSAGSIGNPLRPALAPSQALPAREESAPVMLFDATRGVALSTITFIILTLFLLAGGPPMLARMTSALVNDLEVAHVINVIEKVRSEVGRFYVTTALINIGLGVATGCAMMICGMPNPFLWGTVAAFLNFIPYAGPTATLLLLTVIAAVSFDSFARVAAVACSFVSIAAVEGQMLQPLLVGRRLQLNPMLVFLGLWFGGLFWGIAGIVLATPTLAALKVIAKNSAGGKPVVDFLSPEQPT